MRYRDYDSERKKTVRLLNRITKYGFSCAFITLSANMIDVGLSYHYAVFVVAVTFIAGMVFEKVFKIPDKR